MLMPGMLTDEQMKALDAVRGVAFDTLSARSKQETSSALCRFLVPVRAGSC